MSNYTKPTLKELRNRAISDLNTYLKDVDANLRYKILNTIAIIMAGIGDEVLRRGDYIVNQIFVQYCDESSLIKHGQERSFPRKSASRASGEITISGTIGSIVPAGTSLKRADGILYTTINETTIGSTGKELLSFQADDAGADSNADEGTIITFVSPVSGVETTGSVTDLGITGGSDIEDIEDYRQRLLEYIQNPPSGGSETDYVIWAKEVSGVTRAWCYPMESGIGTVSVRFMMDDIYDDGIPLSGDVETVQSFINALKPATATLYVLAPIADPVNFVFSELTPNTTDAKTAIEENLKSLVQSSSIIPGGELKLSKIRAAISNATGNEDFTLTTPSADIIMDVGHIITMGSVTYPEVVDG